MVKRIVLSAWILTGLVLAPTSASLLEAGQGYGRGRHRADRDPNYRIRSVALELERAARELSYALDPGPGRYGYHDRRDRAHLHRRLERFTRGAHKFSGRLDRYHWSDRKSYQEFRHLSDDYYDLSRTFGYRSRELSRVSHLMRELDSYYGFHDGGRYNRSRRVRDHRTTAYRPRRRQELDRPLGRRIRRRPIFRRDRVAAFATSWLPALSPTIGAPHHRQARLAGASI